jgi:pyruvate kinase
VWATGETVTITTDDVEGTHDRVGTTYEGLAGDVSVGDRLLVDDGRVGLKVVGVDGADVRLLVTEGGPVSNNKGLSLPGVGVSVPGAVRQGRGRPALRPDAAGRHDRPVVRRAARGHRAASTGSWTSWATAARVAKIEKPQAVDNLEEIVDAVRRADGRRGDLGVEMPLERVPLVQKRACRRPARSPSRSSSPTQMLESMIGASRPTRARPATSRTPSWTARTP